MLTREPEDDRVYRLYVLPRWMTQPTTSLAVLRRPCSTADGGRLGSNSPGAGNWLRKESRHD